MADLRSVLAALAVVGWTGTAVSQLTVLRTTEERERIEWTERRNQFLLLSSLSTNALVFATAYRYAKALQTRRA
ncbi:hypothetical protein [Natronobacterium texcoconense]|uniref:Uncharacterized protein n=1 Tax=Natronobacterium texcoconense TaxID=1095778 RepID=A0A1H1FNH5_NATTX|nr:hypothetical protein [Natronobacterium texcoconense]SDR02279.1 hypothetical protein SAMN04489842_2035 [Natronobacterium texcoconense]